MQDPAKREATGTLLHRYLDRHLLDDSFAPAKLDAIAPANRLPAAKEKAAAALHAGAGPATRLGSQ